MKTIETIENYRKGTTIDLYCNYGVLGSEKMNVYTYGGEHPRATCSDKVTVVIPDTWELYENQMGQTMIMAPWGWSYDINEVLRPTKGIPAFCAVDKDGIPYTAYLYTTEELQEKRDKFTAKSEV